jgi:hypothetical protein
MRSLTGWEVVAAGAAVAAAGLLPVVLGVFPEPHALRDSAIMAVIESMLHFLICTFIENPLSLPHYLYKLIIGQLKRRKRRVMNTLLSLLITILYK